MEHCHQWLICVDQGHSSLRHATWTIVSSVWKDVHRLCKSNLQPSCLEHVLAPFRRPFAWAVQPTAECVCIPTATAFSSDILHALQGVFKDTALRLQGWRHGPGFTHTTMPLLPQTWCACQSLTSPLSRESPSSPSISSWVYSRQPLPMHCPRSTRSSSRALTHPYWISTPRPLLWTSMASALHGRAWPCCHSLMSSAS